MRVVAFAFLVTVGTAGCEQVGRYQPVAREGKLHIVDTTNGKVYVPEFTLKTVGADSAKGWSQALTPSQALPRNKLAEPLFEFVPPRSQHSVGRGEWEDFVRSLEAASRQPLRPEEAKELEAATEEARKYLGLPLKSSAQPASPAQGQRTLPPNEAQVPKAQD